MKLTHLIEAVSILNYRRPLDAFGGPMADPEIESIHYRSQDVRPGGLFIAVPGFKADGHDFIDDALARGASAVMVQKPVNRNAAVVEVADTRAAMGLVAGRFFGDPSRRMTVIGITGTNGKTTTSLIIENILKHAGFSTGVIGTIDYHYGGKHFRNPVTTPESLDLQQILGGMRDAGVTHVVMEASSHAIDLGRIDGCWMDVAVFTNLSQDHLDYHGDMARYWECKKRLFTRHLAAGPKGGRAVAVINRNNSQGRELADIMGVRAVTAGFSADNAVWASGIECRLDGISGEMSTPDGRFSFQSPLVGRHNAENILCAAAAAMAVGVSPAAIQSGIAGLRTVPGRLESIPNDRGRFVFVDYAHTPDALENVLAAVKALTKQKIICVFGCGGDRDRKKRPIMGEIAGRLADLAVVTSDNPRTEDPMEIIREMLPGVKQVATREYDPEAISMGLNGRGFLVEPDRRRAIRLAVKASQPGDVILVAGKGHETYQIIGRETLKFDDRIEVREALKRL
ncbi:UDP-N-acetylmuramoyl-L-alanyl-D-glutamate--2,6-diaminopimelate ligase [Desulfococcus sp.]|uniref:UDP-N-acetylmuramoyl-L-alanyl-D-glutamate--2, 6-diaminopimelate ligase n=1 Tax=Desulfococcus sp. TaxID=2025834 RepID=UPI003594581F